MTSSSKSLALAFAAMLLSVAGGVHGDTVAATQPAPSNIAELIKQLGSDSSDERDAAQQKLVDLGGSASSALQQAAKQSQDPEIRSRAAAVLAILHDRTICEASLITLHCKQMSPKDALDAISAQAHAPLTAMGMAVPTPNKPGRTLTIDVDAKPFWETMIEVSRQFNVTPIMQDGPAQRLRLIPSARNWMANNPHQVVGPFYLGVESLTRRRTVDLSGPETTRDEMTVRMNFCAEPKLLVTHVSDVLVKQAEDDAGHSLMPRATPLGMPVEPLRRVEGGNQVRECVLSYPQENAGSKIKLLAGELTVVITGDFQTFQQDDVLGTPKVTSPALSGTFKAAVTRGDHDGVFLVRIDCERGSMSESQWTTMINCSGDVTLSDATGNLLNPAQPVGIHSSGTANFSASGTFIRSRQTAEPAKLVWTFPTSFKSVKVPFKFDNLPMP